MKASHLIKQSSQFIGHAIERRTHPERFIVSDTTAYEAIYTDGMMELRYYPPQDNQTFVLDGDPVTPQVAQHRVPVLLVPPLGVYHWIYDLMAERSWVRFLNAKGFQVYLVNWGAPTHDDAHLGIETYVNQWLNEAVKAVQQHSQQAEISLVGYCMGGLLGLLYAGAYDHGQIRNIVTIASPIDFHVGSLRNRMVKRISQLTRRLPLPETLKDAENFHVPGHILARVFKLTNPLAGVVSYIDLVRNLNDRDYVTAHLTTREWFNNMPDYPGATVQQILWDFWLKNRLAQGQITLGETVSDLGTIKSNLLSFAGKSDKIVSIEAARKLMDIVASKDKQFRIVPGGHAGVFAGGKAQEHTWSITANWLAERSD